MCSWKRFQNVRTEEPGAVSEGIQASKQFPCGVCACIDQSRMLHLVGNPHDTDSHICTE